MSLSPKPTLLIVDDLEDVREFYRDVAEEMDWSVSEAFDTQSFDTALREQYDAIFLDLAMPSMTGIEMLEALAARKERALIVIASGQDDQFLDMSMRLGRDLGLNMVARLSKPIHLPKLEQTLKSLEEKISDAEPVSKVARRA